MAIVGAGAIIGIVIAVIAVSVGSVIGLTFTAKTKDVYDTMTLSSAANTAMDNVVTTIYGAWPLFGVVVLALIGACAFGALMILR